MHSETALVVFPASAALLFPLAALAFKRSSQFGVDTWQTAFVSNMIGAIVYSGLWGMGGSDFESPEWWQPILLACCLFAAMTTQFVALQHGDISVAVPVMSAKILIVAFLAPILVHEPVQPRLWISAVLCVVSVTLLNRPGHAAQRSVSVAVVFGLIAATCFSVFDMLVQRYGPIWGVGRLLPYVFWMNAVLSLVCLFGFRTPLQKIPAEGWKWLLIGSVLVNFQGLLFVSCLAIYGGVTGANIIFSARGLISVLLVWILGSRLGTAESTLDKRVLYGRLAGAVLMLFAILLALWKPHE